MKLAKLKVKNFRNFSDCEILLANKNLIFGMNDVGKSNLIYALRLLFDNRTRNYQIYDTDFHTCNTSEPIEISCYLDISENTINDDFKNIIVAKAENAITDDEKNFIIKLIIEFKDNQYISNLYWGTEDEELLLIPARGLNRSLLDEIFYCVFIPSQNDMLNKFKEFKKELLNNHKKDIEDENIEQEIRQSNQTINEKISQLSTVKEMEKNLNSQLSVFDKNYQIKISPSHTFGDLHNNLDIYMFDPTDTDDDEKPQIYPTSGDGRVRKVMYALISYLLNESTNANAKIPILLIEEPENHLFVSSQIELSKAIFNEDFCPYLFLVTHSPQLFFKISDEANLVRLYKSQQQIRINTEIAKIGEEYNNTKNILLESLAQCLFVNRVLLVEGPSEKLFFEWVLDILDHDRTDIVIQSISGIYFDKYVKILHGLGIKILVKTDNDIAKAPKKDMNNALGFNRCIDLFNILNPKNQEKKLAYSELERDNFRNSINQNYIKIIQKFAQSGIYLSNIDLENDLAECLGHDEEFIKKLQNSKWINMWEFIQDTSETDAEKIFNHPHFKCLQDLVNE